MQLSSRWGGGEISWCFLLRYLPRILSLQLLTLTCHLSLSHHLPPPQAKLSEKTTAPGNSLTITSWETLTKTLCLSKLQSASAEPLSWWGLDLHPLSLSVLHSPNVTSILLSQVSKNIWSCSLFSTLDIYLITLARLQQVSCYVSFASIALP